MSGGDSDEDPEVDTLGEGDDADQDVHEEVRRGAILLKDDSSRAELARVKVRFLQNDADDSKDTRDEDDFAIEEEIIEDVEATQQNVPRQAEKPTEVIVAGRAQEALKKLSSVRGLQVPRKSIDNQDEDTGAARDIIVPDCSLGAAACKPDYSSTSAEHTSVDTEDDIEEEKENKTAVEWQSLQQKEQKLSDPSGLLLSGRFTESQQTPGARTSYSSEQMSFAQLKVSDSAGRMSLGSRTSYTREQMPSDQQKVSHQGRITESQLSSVTRTSSKQEQMPSAVDTRLPELSPRSPGAKSRNRHPSPLESHSLLPGRITESQLSPVTGTSSKWEQMPSAVDTHMTEMSPRSPGTKSRNRHPEPLESHSLLPGRITESQLSPVTRTSSKREQMPSAVDTRLPELSPRSPGTRSRNWPLSPLERFRKDLRRAGNFKPPKPHPRDQEDMATLQRQGQVIRDALWHEEAPHHGGGVESLRSGLPRPQCKLQLAYRATWCLDDSNNPKYFSK